jgi:hypothetical protein
MEPRVLILALPSLVVLALLAWHSLRSLPRRRAAAFWVSVAVYGVLRGMAVAWVTREGLGASLPYQIRDPLLSVFGVSLQEVAGWAIVAYLAWWLGERFARQEKKGPRLFLQVAWGCLFLGAISWAVEAAAIAAGWWHWTVPAGSEMLLRVPWIGLVDWFFVGTDFLLPFLVLTAPALAGRPVRFLALLLFPLHMASHLWVAPVAEGVPIPGFHLVHWLLLGLVLWLALRSPVPDEAFAGDSSFLTTLPAAALGIVLLDAALVELLLVERPELLASLGPAVAVALQGRARADGGARFPRPGDARPGRQGRGGSEAPARRGPAGPRPGGPDRGDEGAFRPVAGPSRFARAPSPARRDPVPHRPAGRGARLL